MTSHFEPEEPWPDALACDIAALFEHNGDQARVARRRRTYGAGWALLLVAAAVTALPTGLATDRLAPVRVAAAVAPPHPTPAGDALPIPADARAVAVATRSVRHVPRRLQYALSSALPMAASQPMVPVVADAPAPSEHAHVDAPSAEVRVAQVSAPPPPPSAYVAIAPPPPQVIVDGPSELRREHRRYAAIDAIHNLRRQ